MAVRRITIRNDASPNRVKPRVFDALIEDGTVLLEVKGNRGNEIVPLSSVLRQIESARGKREYRLKHKSTEP